jgi:hypothetical protein
MKNMKLLLIIIVILIISISALVLLNNLHEASLNSDNQKITLQKGCLNELRTINTRVSYLRKDLKIIKSPDQPILIMGYAILMDGTEHPFACDAYCGNTPESCVVTNPEFTY